MVFLSSATRGNALHMNPLVGLVILVKAASKAWSQYLSINYPLQLVVTGFVAMAIVLSLFWTRWPAIR